MVRMVEPDKELAQMWHEKYLRDIQELKSCEERNDQTNS